MSSGHTGLLSFELHYRVPVAKNKPDTNCTVAGTNACVGKWSTAKSI